MKAAGLRTEKATDPIGIDAREPRLSWRLDADAGETDVVQEAFQVEVSDGDDVVWDSGQVESRAQLVRYAGPALPSRARRTWRVRAWTSAGETLWSEPASFEMGLLDARDWSAKMITTSETTPVVRFATTFDVRDDVDVARLRITAHGLFEARIDGRPVTDEVLAPGWTSYNARLAVRTLDVTNLVRRGTNEIEVLVAPGWFSGRFGFGDRKQVYGTHTGLLAQLEIRPFDAEPIVVATGPSWTASTTAFAEASIYDGETFDARLASDGGEALAIQVLHGFDVSELVAPTVPPVRRTQELRPVSRTIVDDGVLQLDFGQNLVGWMRVTFSDAAEGAEIVMRHAEVLGPDGRLFTAPLRTAKATDTYIAAGDAIEIYEPRFTFHGFRYAEISGIDPDNVDAVGVVVHSDIERTGTLETGDDLLDRLHLNVVWGQRGNFVSVPTDCPQRDERLGWTGDAQVFSPTASYLYDCETFWENWLADLAADQRDDGMVPPIIPDIGIGMGNGAAGWGDAAVVVPWTTYEAYGDDTVIRNQMPSMTSWVDWVWSRLDEETRWGQDFQFGDWLDPDAPTEQPWRAKARYDVVATAYCAHVTDLLSRMARVVGDDATASTYAERFAQIREAWWRNFADAASGSQTGCALGIEFGLAPSDDATQSLGDALAKLVRDAGDHLATGFLGTPLLLPALTRTGHIDVAYDVLQQETPPGWLYTVKAGATTIWERWDALRPDGTVPLEALGTPGGSGAGMVSFNHYAYGCVADWMHRTVAGIAPDVDEPGFRHVIVAPKPGGRLRSVSASLESRYGHTATAWRIDDGRFTLDVTVPPNAHATVTLPDGSTSEMGSGSRTFDCAID